MFTVPLGVTGRLCSVIVALLEYLLCSFNRISMAYDPTLFTACIRQA